MRAARTDSNQSTIVRALESAGASVTLLHRVGEGCPDLLIADSGQWGLIEVKDGSRPPSQRKKTPAQIKWWDKNVNGGARAIVTDVDGALRFLSMLRVSPSCSDRAPDQSGTPSTPPGV